MEYVIGREKNYTKLNRHWQYSVGADHAKQFLRIDFIKQLKFVHDELGIDRVRFHGIFCDDMYTLDTITDLLPVPGISPMTERSFYYCGLVYDNILSIGMKPIVELSFMPSPIADGEPGNLFYQSNVNKPKTYELWDEHITAFIEYLIHRYGREEIEKWQFEVWNEPNISQAFFHGNQEDYFELYKHTVMAIKSIDEKISVGGPASAGSEWIAEFVAYCKKENLPIDFISTHQYSGEPLQGVGREKTQIEKEKEEKKRNPFAEMDDVIKAITPETTQLEMMRMVFGEPGEEEDCPVNVFRNNAKIVRKQAGEIPVLYDEWNYSATFGEYGNDGIKAGAY